MKVEMTLENKARFFVQYWGQDVLKLTKNLPMAMLDSHNINVNILSSYLELKPLSLITDEDAIEVAIQNRFKGKNIEAQIKVGREILTRIKANVEFDPICMPLETGDYLRSKGYAIPWMELSVENMVEAGWIKLVE